RLSIIQFAFVVYGYRVFSYLPSFPTRRSSDLCLYIHPKFRGQGISGGLIEAAVDLAKEKGATEILAFPIPEDARRHFPEHDGEFSGRMSSYRKLGFRTGERINDFYQVMSLDVAGAKGE